jgi:hypothetical protein
MTLSGSVGYKLNASVKDSGIGQCSIQNGKMDKHFVEEERREKHLNLKQ